MKVTLFGATGAIAHVGNPDKVPPHRPTDRVDIVVGTIADPIASTRPSAAGKQ